MILFRCDASPSLGMGHLVRCRTLAGALKEHGQECVLVGPPIEYRTDADAQAFHDWIPIVFGRSALDDARRLLALLAERSSRCAVLDDYRVDEDYQAELLRNDVKWLQFNRDPSQPLWAHLVLNQSPDPSEADYSAIRNPDTRLLLGPRFALLRPEFADAACERSRGGPRRVLVTFGGGHDRGGVVAVLRALLPGLPTDVRFVVISGAQNPANREITRWIGSHGRGRVVLHVDPPRVAPLIASCDLAVMAGGGTVFEVNRFGIPMLLIAIADNQVEHSRAWERQGAAKYLGEIGTLDPDSLLSAANCAIAALADASEVCRVPRLVDGQGRVRVAEEMIGAFGL